MILYENQYFELFYSVPQNPNVGRFEIASTILNTFKKLKDIEN